MLEFQEFPKIPRLRRDCVITEKLDGTNAAIRIVPAPHDNPNDTTNSIDVVNGYAIYAQSRSRFITPGADNFGFAAWVYTHAQELVEGLGEGTHFGEWWGSGIQRGYGQTARKFSLFNTGRWDCETNRPPECCSVVPVLYSGVFSDAAVSDTLNTLRQEGSRASPGFMRPEGVIVYHTAARAYYKVLLENDNVPKGVA